MEDTVSRIKIILIVLVAISNGKSIYLTFFSFCPEIFIKTASVQTDLCVMTGYLIINSSMGSIGTTTADTEFTLENQHLKIAADIFLSILLLLGMLGNMLLFKATNYYVEEKKEAG